MWKLTLTAGFFLAFASFASSNKLLCSYNSMAEERAEDGQFSISDIDPNLCTHLIYSFADLKGNKIAPANVDDLQRYIAFNALKESNPKLKTLLAVGGITFGNQKFSSMVQTKENRAEFIDSVIKLLRTMKFDGLDIDWRYPGGPGSQPEDKQRFTALCKELKDAFEADGIAQDGDRLILSASVSAERDIIDASYEVEKIAMDLDFINVLTFDFHGPWETVTGHHSPLYSGSKDTGDQIYSNADSAMRHWRDQGAPADKLNMGIGAFGRAFTLASDSTAVGAQAKGPAEEGCYTGEEGFWASYEICIYLEGVEIQHISDQKVPYATTENQWVGFDDTTSLEAKASYLKENSFGGVFVWSLDLDDFKGEFCNQGKNPFISQLHDLLVPGFNAAPENSASITPPKITETTQSTTTTTTSASSVFKCDGRTGYFLDPTDAHYYYHCDGTTANREACPGNGVFNEDCSCCKAQTPVETSPPTTTTQSTTTTTQSTTTPTQSTTTPTQSTTTTTQSTTTTTTSASSVFECDGRTGYFPDPKDAHYYYHCDGTTANREACPGNGVFNEDCSCCKAQTPVETSSPTTTTQSTTTTTQSTTTPTQSTTTPTQSTTTTTKSTTTTTTPASSEFDCTGKVGYYPDPEDAHFFYHCDGTFAHRKACPPDLVFTMTCRCCVRQTQGEPSPQVTASNTPLATTPKTTSTTTTPSMTTTTTSASSVFKCDGRTGYFLDPTDAHYYYHCDGTTANREACPGNGVFNEDCSCCKAQTPVETSSPTTTTQSTTTTTQSTTTPTQSTTTPTQSTTTTTKSTTTTTTPASSEFDCTGKVGYFPDPKDAHFFYHCDGTFAHHKVCSHNLVFKMSCTCCTFA